MRWTVEVKKVKSQTSQRLHISRCYGITLGACADLHLCENKDWLSKPAIDFLLSLYRKTGHSEIDYELDELGLLTTIKVRPYYVPERDELP